VQIQSYQVFWRCWSGLRTSLMKKHHTHTLMTL
jgi:hypothetical protein